MIDLAYRQAAGWRSAGVLLHPTSLPGRYGTGDLGAAARAWLSWLASCRIGLWQMLPLGPTGIGDSPYQSPSTFAGNPLLISLEDLAAEGWLSEDELPPASVGPPDRADFAQAAAIKMPALTMAAASAPWRAHAEALRDFRGYCERNVHWLDDYALFAALKRQHPDLPWTAWETPLARRQPQALASARSALAEDIQNLKWQQYFFDRQWAALRQTAAGLGIKLIGDVPIYVAHDSAEVWAQPEFFDLDEMGHPNSVAGVPPDYFSPTGQRWGNPLYCWEHMEGSGFVWWVARMRAALERSDFIRLDHFRGFAGYWEIPAEAPTAEAGEWQAAPGRQLMEAMRQALGELPLIAEDLGVITDDVVELRRAFDLPGMRVLQFAFDGGPDNPFLPHNYTERTVAYTGTHDNDTFVGWFAHAEEEERRHCLRYLDCDPQEVAWHGIRAVWGSVAAWAIAPLQDLLGLGSEGRMNFPGRELGNWRWRLRAEQLSDLLAERTGELTDLYGRAVSGALE
jgi:4-alpha-glucanotransferase